jgi:hypothetical protein
VLPSLSRYLGAPGCFLLGGIYLGGAFWLWNAGGIRWLYGVGVFLSGLALLLVGVAVLLTSQHPPADSATAEARVYYRLWLEAARQRTASSLTGNRRVSMQFAPGAVPVLRVEAGHLAPAEQATLVAQLRRDFAAQNDRSLAVQLVGGGPGAP